MCQVQRNWWPPEVNRSRGGGELWLELEAQLGFVSQLMLTPACQSVLDEVPHLEHWFACPHPQQRERERDNCNSLIAKQLGNEAGKFIFGDILGVRAVPQISRIQGGKVVTSDGSRIEWAGSSQPNQIQPYGRRLQRHRKSIFLQKQTRKVQLKFYVCDPTPTPTISGLFHTGCVVGSFPFHRWKNRKWPELIKFF